MARQKNGFKVASGTMFGMTFSKGGKTVGEKSSLTGQRVKTAPEFANTRKNMTEFGLANQIAATILRGAKRVTREHRNAMTKKVLEAIKADTTNPLGERKLNSTNIQRIVGIAQNKTARQILNVEPVFDINAETVTLTGVNPRNFILPIAFHHVTVRVRLVGEDTNGNPINALSDPLYISARYPVDDYVINTPPMALVSWAAFVIELDASISSWESWSDEIFDPLNPDPSWFDWAANPLTSANVNATVAQIVGAVVND